MDQNENQQQSYYPQQPSAPQYDQYQQNQPYQPPVVPQTVYPQNRSTKKTGLISCLFGALGIVNVLLLLFVGFGLGTIWHIMLGISGITLAIAGLKTERQGAAVIGLILNIISILSAVLIFVVLIGLAF